MYSELEIRLILNFSNRRGADVKTKDSGNPDEFFLMFREYKRQWPMIRLPIAYWDLSRADDCDVSNDTSRNWPCRGWVTPGTFIEVDRDDFLAYIKTEV